MSAGRPAVDCPTWCERSNGHATVHPADDRECVSESRTISLSRCPPLGDETASRVRDQLVAFIHREAGDSVPHIRLRYNDSAPLDLSVDDALRLAAELRSLIEEA